MSEPPDSKSEQRAGLERKIARRKRRQREKRSGVVFGLGVFGLVGWSVAIPTVLGAGLGWWLDRRLNPAGFSWTLALLMAGVALGCFNAWYWIERERSRPILLKDETVPENEEEST